MSQSRVLPHYFLEVWSARIKACPVVQVEVSIVREEIMAVGSPLKSLSGLDSLNSFHVLVDSTKLEFNFSTRLGGGIIL